jgi:hypothetical protein
MNRKFFAVVALSLMTGCVAKDAPAGHNGGGVGGGGNGVGGVGGSVGGGNAGAPGNGVGSLGGSVGGGPVGTDWVSGTRLRARVLTTADGAKSQWGWYDTQLGINCFIATAGDGQQRCLPQTYAAVGTYFADSACTTQLAWIPTSYATACAPTLGYWAETTNSCSEYGAPASRTHLYSLGAVYTGTVYYAAPTGCSPTAPTGATFYQVGAETPPTTYVAATITTE